MLTRHAASRHAVGRLPALLHASVAEHAGASRLSTAAGRAQAGRIRRWWLEHHERIQELEAAQRLGQQAGTSRRQR